MKRHILAAAIATAAPAALAQTPCVITTSGVYDWHFAYQEELSPGVYRMEGFLFGTEAILLGCVGEPAGAAGRMDYSTGEPRFLVDASTELECVDPGGSEQLHVELVFSTAPVGGLLQGTVEADNGFSTSATATAYSCLDPVIP